MQSPRDIKRDLNKEAKLYFHPNFNFADSWNYTLLIYGIIQIDAKLILLIAKLILPFCFSTAKGNCWNTQDMIQSA